MSEVKQVIVVRKDLNMRKGKMAAQVAHASMKSIFDLMPNTDSLLNHHKRSLWIRKGSALDQWMNGIFTKIVLSVDSEEELLELEKIADEKKIRNALIIDAGRTEFNGVPTKTALALGPDYSDKIDEITGGLPLL